MYNYIYFDLDNTLVKDNPNTSKSEILKSGYDEYIRLKNKYPGIPFRLLSDRIKEQISYPNVYEFEEVVGSDQMSMYIINNMHKIPWTVFLNPLNIYIYLRGLSLYRRFQIYKVYYLFLRHICNGEKVLMIDNDKRVSLVFRW